MSDSILEHTRDVGAMDTLFWQLRRSCALGRVLEVHSGAGELLRRLVEHGVDAFGAEGDLAAVHKAELLIPGRTRAIADHSLPYADQEFDTAICTRGIAFASDVEVARFAAEIRRVARRHVLVTVAPTATRPREWWDRCFLKAGFRRHPALLQIVDYASMDAETNCTLLFERVEDAALVEYPLERLAAERDLHMDMLREAGRRSDAHLQRYAFAAGLVGRNDTVLDAACGLGYGLAVIAATGRAANLIGVDDSAYAVEYARSMYGGTASRIDFVRSDAQSLAGVADHSVNLVISFETLEHLSDPGAFLANVQRVLKPGGRFVASVPNLWVDASGRDPNPHHLHVFDVERLLAVLRWPFIIEHVIAETAGGGMKELPNPIRSWQRVEQTEAPTVPAEWWVVVAMKDPRTGVGLPYEETSHRTGPGLHVPACLSFPAAYENPWMRHAVVTHGVRLADPRALTDLARAIGDEAGEQTVDLAATLCVRGYELLRSPGERAENIRNILAEIDKWLASTACISSRHHHRWRMSLEYLAGRLCLLAGNRDAALAWFERCAGRDPLIFSPLLATKAVDAAYTAGLMHAWSGRDRQARAWWMTGLDHAARACAADWREIAGDRSEPLAFGVRELSEVLDHAARCAAGIESLKTWNSSPGRLAELLAADCRQDGQRVAELDAYRRACTRDARDARDADAERVTHETLHAERVNAGHLREQLHDAEERLGRLRAVVVAGASRSNRRTTRRLPGRRHMSRIVIFDAGETGRRLWEALAARPTVEIVGFVDLDPRRHGRTFLASPVHPVEWLRESDGWDQVAVAAGDVNDWEFPLAAAGASGRRVLELPLDGGSEFLSQLVADLFPDPLAGMTTDAPPANGLRIGIFGTGAAGMKVWEALADEDAADAVWFADNNPAQQGREILGLSVIAPQDISAHPFDAVIVASMSRDPICEQLRYIGVASDRILTPVVAGSIDDLRRDLARAFAPLASTEVSA